MAASPPATLGSTLAPASLRHLGVPTETPVPRPARAPPLPEGTPDVAGWDDDTVVFEPCS